MSKEKFILIGADSVINITLQVTQILNSMLEL